MYRDADEEIKASRRFDNLLEKQEFGTKRLSYLVNIMCDTFVWICYFFIYDTLVINVSFLLNKLKYFPYVSVLNAHSRNDRQTTQQSVGPETN